MKRNNNYHETRDFVTDISHYGSPKISRSPIVQLGIQYVLIPQFILILLLISRPSVAQNEDVYHRATEQQLKMSSIVPPGTAFRVWLKKTDAQNIAGLGTNATSALSQPKSRSVNSNAIGDMIIIETFAGDRFLVWGNGETIIKAQPYPKHPVKVTISRRRTEDKESCAEDVEGLI